MEIFNSAKQKVCRNICSFLKEFHVGFNKLNLTPFGQEPQFCDQVQSYVWVTSTALPVRLLEGPPTYRTPVALLHRRSFPEANKEICCCHPLHIIQTALNFFTPATFSFRTIKFGSENEFKKWNQHTKETWCTSCPEPFSASFSFWFSSSADLSFPDNCERFW